MGLKVQSCGGLWRVLWCCCCVVGVVVACGRGGLTYRCGGDGEKPEPKTNLHVVCVSLLCSAMDASCLVRQLTVVVCLLLVGSAMCQLFIAAYGISDPLLYRHHVAASATAPAT